MLFCWQFQFLLAKSNCSAKWRFYWSKKKSPHLFSKSSSRKNANGIIHKNPKCFKFYLKNLKNSIFCIVFNRLRLTEWDQNWFLGGFLRRKKKQTEIPFSFSPSNQIQGHFGHIFLWIRARRLEGCSEMNFKIGAQSTAKWEKFQKEFNIFFGMKKSAKIMLFQYVLVTTKCLVNYYFQSVAVQKFQKNLLRGERLAFLKKFLH